MPYMYKYNFVYRVPEKFEEIFDALMYVWDTKAMLPVESRPKKKARSWKSVRGGRGGRDGYSGKGGGGNGGCSGNSGGVHGRHGRGCPVGAIGDVGGGVSGGGGGDGRDGGSDGGDNDEFQVVREVLKEDLHGKSVAFQQYYRNLFRTERVFFLYDENHIRLVMVFVL